LLAPGCVPDGDARERQAARGAAIRRCGSDDEIDHIEKQVKAE
jgi:hypothetical protein